MLNKKEIEKKFNESAIYNFNDCDTVYIPKGYTLQEAIDWYTKEYDEIDKIYDVNPSDFNQYNLGKDKKVKEGTIEYRFGDLYIFKTFKTAKEENDKLESPIFVICSREW